MRTSIRWQRLFRGLRLFLPALLTLLWWGNTWSGTAGERPNILVLWGEDVDASRISAYTHGAIGYHTPGLDRIAREGMAFTDYYGELPRGAGPVAFLTGQSVYRVGLFSFLRSATPPPRARQTPTIATLLHDRGYATGRFGRPLAADGAEQLPLRDGFDELFVPGLTPELCARSEETDSRARDNALSAMRQRLPAHDRAGRDDPAVPAENGAEGCGRAHTLDDATAQHALAFIDEQTRAGRPWFVWWSGARTPPRSDRMNEVMAILGQHGAADGMVEHDRHVGQFLAALDALGVAANTIVVYAGEHGTEAAEWSESVERALPPEPQDYREGNWRVPAMVRWPGHIPPGQWNNQIVHHMDWLPTLLAAAGVPHIRERLLDGYPVAGQEYTAHLDGYDLLAMLTGETAESPRHEIFYFSPNGELTALRYNDVKFVFRENKNAPPLRMPLVENLRRPAAERTLVGADTYLQQIMSPSVLLLPAQAEVMNFLASFQDSSSRQRLDEVLDAIALPGIY